MGHIKLYRYIYLLYISITSALIGLFWIQNISRRACYNFNTCECRYNANQTPIVFVISIIHLPNLLPHQVIAIAVELQTKQSYEYLSQLLGSNSELPSSPAVVGISFWDHLHPTAKELEKGDFPSSWTQADCARIDIPRHLRYRRIRYCNW